MSQSPKDKFEELFRMQQSLNERIGVRTSGMSEEDQIKWLLNYTRAMTQEIAELTDSVPWKWWAKYQKFDTQNARVEVVDLFHFLISMAQVLGMSADDVFNAYLIGLHGQGRGRFQTYLIMERRSTDCGRDRRSCGRQ